MDKYYHVKQISQLLAEAQNQLNNDEFEELLNKIHDVINED